MADVFVSYKVQDLARVLPLVTALKAQGFSVWWDQDLLPGDRIPEIIRKTLSEVSCVIVAWSELAVKSNWVPDEATYGRDHDKLIPISLDGTEPPLGFQQLRTEPLLDWSGDVNDPRIQKVFAAVRGALARSHAAAPMPPVGPAVNVPPAAPPIEEFRRQYEATRNKRVFLIVGSFNEEWQVSLNVQLMQGVQALGVACTVLVPAKDHSFDQQRTLLQRIQTFAADYLGGFVVASGWPDEQMSELVKLASGFAAPVVLVDRNPPLGPQPVPAGISYVAVSDSAGGQTAADAVLQLAREEPIHAILVIAGFAKAARHQAFVERIKASGLLKDCDISVTTDGQFDRWVAENLTYNLLDEALRNKRPFDLIFCTADSMTLGCLDAIARMRHWRNQPKPRVIGYDGTATTRKLAEDRRSPLVRVVVQDTEKLAQEAISRLLLPYRDGEGPELTGTVTWIEPYLFPRFERVPR